MHIVSRSACAMPVGMLMACLMVLESGCSTFQRSGQVRSSTSYKRTGEQGSSVRQVSYEEELEASRAGETSSLKDGLQVDDLSPDRVSNSIKAATGFGPDREKAQRLHDRADEAYEKAKELYERDPESSEAEKLFAKSGKAFWEASKHWPESALEQDSLFKSGEAYFFSDHYSEANDSFERLIDRYPGSRFLDMAQARRFAIAEYWLALAREETKNPLAVNLTDKRRPMRDMHGHALRIYDRIRLDDPTGKLADDATMALASAYFEAGRYLDAAETYEDLRIAFPTSQHQVNAHMLELKSRLQAYQGSAYDGAHLDKADKLLESLMKQFPTEIDDERDELEKLASEVRFRLAEREMKMARFYDSTGHYRSATIYYQEVVERYPGSPQADEARARIDAIASKPASPPQRAKWLIDLFPQADETKPLIPSSPTKAALK